MSGYSFTYEESRRKLVSKGTYETILSLEKRRTDNGKNYISLRHLIRDDVEQDFQLSSVYEKIWEDKENPGRFPTKKLNKILSVQGEKGKYNFDDIDEVLQFINGWNLRIGVGVGEPDDYNDEEYNYVTFYGPTKFPAQTLGEVKPVTHDKPKFELKEENDDEDYTLPF